MEQASGAHSSQHHVIANYVAMFNRSRKVYVPQLYVHRYLVDSARPGYYTLKTIQSVNPLELGGKHQQVTAAAAAAAPYTWRSVLRAVKVSDPHSPPPPHSSAL